MPIPTITPLPDAPSRTDEPSVFVTKADAFVAALPIFGDEMNDLGGYLEGLSAGTLDGNLAAIAGVTSAADTLPYFTGSETAALADFTAFGRTLVANADAASARSDLSVYSASEVDGLVGGGASTTQTTEMIAGFIAAPADKDYRIVVKMAHGGTITETTTRSASGTCTATFKVNTTALGGTANSVSSSEQSQAHSGTNTFVAGDDIVITVSSNSACVDMSFSIQYTRTLA